MSKLWNLVDGLTSLGRPGFAIRSWDEPLPEGDNEGVGGFAIIIHPPRDHDPGAVASRPVRVDADRPLFARGDSDRPLTVPDAELVAGAVVPRIARAAESIGAATPTQRPVVETEARWHAGAWAAWRRQPTAAPIADGGDFEPEPF